jgi:hypothetical protein
MSEYLQKAGLHDQNLMNALQRMGIITPGQLVFLDPTNGDDDYDGLTIDRAVKSFAVAYAKLTAGQHDVLIYISGSSSLSIDEAIVWAKDYTHFVGVSADVPMAKRSRIFHSENFSPMITVSASGCIFKDLYFSDGRGGDDNHVLMLVSGDRNVFDNIHYAGMNHATESADASSVAVQVTGGDENLWKNCVFGNDTIARSGANATMSFSSGSARNFVKDSYFMSYSSDANPVAVRVDATGVDRFVMLENCVIVNHGTSLTQAIDSNITDTTARKIIVKGSFNTIGCTDVADATGDSTIFVPNPTSTANVIGLATNPAVA